MAKKLSNAQKIRNYISAHPEASAKEIAQVLKLKAQYVHQTMYADRKRLQPKKMILERAEVELANKLGISTAEYATQKANILREPKMKRIALFSSNTPITMEEPKADPVNHPAHYKVGGMETIDFIEAKGLSYHLGNAVKYISRADHKGNRKQDLEKAKWYLERAIAQA
jgi:Trm5-related predicted tRNA methylase